MDMRMDLQNLQIITSSITTSVNDRQDLVRDELLSAFSVIPSYTTKMVEDRMERALQKHTAQVESSTTTALLTDQNARLDPLIRRPPRLGRR